MIRKLARVLIATAVASVAAFAQTGTASAAQPMPSAPSASMAGANAPAATPAAGGSRVGTINVEQAIFATNEGQRDFDELSKKLEPKQTELKNQSDEIESLKKQLNTQSDKLNDDARGKLVKQVELKQKSFERSMQDARDDAQAQQNEIAQRILQKMAPMLVKYANDNGFGVIIDTSNPWPNGPVLWAGTSVDITKGIVDAYNAQSGVPAPPPRTGGGAAGATTKPASPLTKPATTPAKPQTPQIPPK
ncbi:MAG TPA: OmpH family outer membrane protein [Terriglobales bacterium]